MLDLLGFEIRKFQLCILLFFRLYYPGSMGHASCQWNYVADSERKGATVFSSPPVQVMETREGTQSDQHPGSQLPHPSIEREALWPINPDQRALPEGAASWRENTPASVDAKGLGQCDPEEHRQALPQLWRLCPACFSNLQCKSNKKTGLFIYVRCPY